MGIMKQWGLMIFLLFGQASTVYGDSEMASESTKAKRVQDIVKMVVEHYKIHGAQATFDKLNSGWTLDGDIYAGANSVVDGTIVAHAANPDLVGKSASGVVNSEGRYVVQEILDTATEAGIWIQYKWINPANGMDEEKRAWLVRIDDYIIGCGYYL